MQRDLFETAVRVVPPASRIECTLASNRRDEFWMEDFCMMDAPEFVPMGSHKSFDYENKGVEFIICSHVSRRRVCA